MFQTQKPQSTPWAVEVLEIRVRGHSHVQCRFPMGGKHRGSRPTQTLTSNLPRPMENNVLKGKGQDRSRNNGTRSKILKDPSTLTEIFPGAREALTQFMKSGPLSIDRAEIWDQKRKSFIEFATKMKPKTMDNTPPATPVHVPSKSQNPGKNQMGNSNLCYP